MLRKLALLLATAVMSLPLFAQTAPTGVIAITGANLVLGEDSISIEGVASVLPTVFATEDGLRATFSLTEALVNDWNYGIEKAAELNLTAEDFYATITLEFETVFSGSPSYVEIFDQTLVVTAPSFADGVLSFTVLEAGDIVARVDDKSEVPASATVFNVNVVYEGAFLDAIVAAAQKRAADGRVTTVVFCNPRSTC